MFWPIAWKKHGKEPGEISDSFTLTIQMEVVRFAATER